MEILLIPLLLVAIVGIVIGAKRGAEAAQRDREARWGGLAPSPGLGPARGEGGTADPGLESGRGAANPGLGPVPGEGGAVNPGRDSGASAPAADAAGRPSRGAAEAVAQGASATATAIRSSASAALKRRPAVIDLNRAPVSELQNLPGVGVRAAERIVAHRERNGEFSTVEELTAVEGFDQHRVGRLVPHATV